MKIDMPNNSNIMEFNLDGLRLNEAFDKWIESNRMLCDAIMALTTAIDNKKLNDNIAKAGTCSHCNESVLLIKPSISRDSDRIKK